MFLNILDLNVLYFPVKGKFIPELKDKEISVTGFAVGDERDYMKDLIQITGANYAPDLSKSARFLIFFKPVGAKYDAANQWKIPTLTKDVANYNIISRCLKIWLNLGQL